jgi:hypothetical protein
MEEVARLATVSMHGELKTYAESQTRPDAAKWKEAVDAEWNSLIKNETWEVVPKPKGLRDRDIVSSKFVFKIKLDSKGDIERYKARLVARGFTQTEGINYEETFAPVARMTSMRVMFAMSAEQDLELDHMDVMTAYLNSVLAEKIYMLPPEDGSMGDIPEGMVLLVEKGLYGLKQSGKTWYDTIDGKFAEYGFAKLDVDHGIYTRVESDGRFILIGLYVDDLALTSNSHPYLDSFKVQFASELTMSDLGELRWFLAMCILRNHELSILSID